MVNKHESVSAVRSYLVSCFPDCEVADRLDFDTRGQVFTLERGARLLLVRVSHEFLTDLDSSEIGRLLLAWNLGEALRTSSDVLLTRAGVRVGDERPGPFEVKVPNATTRKAIADLEAGSGKRFNGTAALMADLNADD